MNSLAQLNLRRALVFAAVIAGIGFSSGTAVGQSRVAFTKKDRLKIFFYDGSKLDSTAVFGPGVGITGKQYAVLGATSDGKTLLIGGHFFFPNLGFQPDSAYAIACIDSPFYLPTQTDVVGRFRFMKRYLQSPSLNTFVPLGAITPNNQEWYATITGTQPGAPPVWFYHGFLNQSDLGSAAIDSIQYPTTMSDQIQGDYHMSNIAVSPGGDIMICVIVDQLNNDAGGPVYHAMKWQPSPPTGVLPFSTHKFSSTVSSLFHRSNVDIDFGFGLRINSQNQAQLLLCDSMSDLLRYQYDYNGSQVTFQGQPTVALPVADIPSDQYFFSNFQADAQAAQKGNGSDIQMIGNSDSLLFVTHDISGGQNPAKAAIYMYDGSSANMIYNDSSALELQPIWVYGKPLAPPKPGYIVASATSLDFKSHEYTKDTSITAMFTNPSGKIVVIDKAEISGTDVADFAIFTNTKGVPLPDTLAIADSLGFVIKYTASSPARVENAVLTVHYDGVPDSMLQVQLTGTSLAPQKGVAAAATSAMTLTVAPNPFTTSTKIALTASRSGVASIEVRDVLGRVVYSGKPSMLVAGMTAHAEFDARALGLSNGVYYLSARLAGEVMTREMVLVR